MAAPAKLRADAQRNRDRVFDAAKAAFAEHGARTSMDEIARRSGVGVGTLYRAFGSRSGLVEALYEDMVAQLEERAERDAGTAEPSAALKGWLRAYAAALSSKRTMLAELTPLFQRRPDVLERSRDAAAAVLASLLQAAQSAGEVRDDLRAADLVALVNAVLAATPPGDAARTDLLLDVMLDGMRAPGRSAAA